MNMAGILDSLGIVSIEGLQPIYEMLKKLDEQNKLFQQEQEKAHLDIAQFKKRVEELESKVATCEQTVAELNKKVTDLQKKSAPSPSVTPAHIENTESNKADDKKRVTTPLSSNPKKRYYSGCSSVGFDRSYLLTAADAINGQGYYEVTDRDGMHGSYQPNTALGATLIMNAATMLEPIFDITHDGSGLLKVVAPGEVLKQERIWQIVKRGTISY